MSNIADEFAIALVWMTLEVISPSARDTSILSLNSQTNFASNVYELVSKEKSLSLSLSVSGASVSRIDTQHAFIKSSKSLSLSFSVSRALVSQLDPF